MICTVICIIMSAIKMYVNIHFRDTVVCTLLRIHRLLYSGVFDIVLGHTVIQHYKITLLATKALYLSKRHFQCIALDWICF